MLLKKRLMKKIYIILILLHSNIIFPQAGSLDLSFGSSGKNISCHIDNIFEVANAFQTTGKLISFGRNDSTNNWLYILRYNLDGTIDTSFGTNGYVGDAEFGQTFAGGISSIDMVVLPDNKILLLVRKNLNAANNYIVRLTANGVLDNTFNGTGYINFGIGLGQYYDWAITMQLQPDGKILVGGKSEAPLGEYYTLVRLNSNGTFDTTFGTNGKVYTQIFSGQSGIKSIVVLPNGKILTGGYCNDGVTKRYVLVQYTTTGNLDTTFGTNGITVVPALQYFRWDELGKILVRPDGRILIGGLTNSLGQPAAIQGIGLTQYLANGALDTTFGINGIKIIPDRVFKDMALQVDGKILLVAANFSFEAIRTLPNGTIDTSFGTGGYVNEFINMPGSESAGVLIQSDNKIIVTGQAYTGQDQNGNSISCLAAMRLNPGVLKNDSFTNANDIVVYPNPTNGSVFINSESYQNEVFKIKIVNTLGQLLYETENVTLNNKELNVSNLAIGTYFVTFTNEFRTFQKKIVLK